MKHRPQLLESTSWKDRKLESQGAYNWSPSSTIQICTSNDTWWWRHTTNASIFSESGFKPSLFKNYPKCLFCGYQKLHFSDSWRIHIHIVFKTTSRLLCWQGDIVWSPRQHNFHNLQKYSAADFTPKKKRLHRYSSLCSINNEPLSASSASACRYVIAKSISEKIKKGILMHFRCTTE